MTELLKKIKIVYDDEDKLFIATHRGFQFISGVGETSITALKELLFVLEDLSKDSRYRAAE